MITFRGKQTCYAGVYYNAGRGIKCSAVLHTDGRGLWSNESRAVKITGLALSYVNDRRDFGELRVFFNLRTWNTLRHGLIYTDDLWIKELRAYLKTLGFRASRIGYSEQGMQGDNYVSLDVNRSFIDSWLKIVYNNVREKFNSDFCDDLD